MTLDTAVVSTSCQATLDYSNAHQRLKIFENESVGWDGCGGLPASQEVVREVSPFLELVKSERLHAPGLAMGGDGSVAVVWTNEQIYISADFDGTGSYSYFASSGDVLVCDGFCSANALDERLAEHLKAHFSYGMPA